MPENGRDILSLVGELIYIGMDKIPQNDLETNCASDSLSKALAGREVYLDPDDPSFIYTYEHHYWAKGDYPAYLACLLIEDEAPIADSIVIDLYSSAENFENHRTTKSVVLVENKQISYLRCLMESVSAEAVATSRPMDFPRFVVTRIEADNTTEILSEDCENCIAGSLLGNGNHISDSADFYGEISGIIDDFS